MQYIFNKPTWEAYIDYFSVEIHNKIAENIAKKSCKFTKYYVY